MCDVRNCGSVFLGNSESVLVCYLDFLCNLKVRLLCETGKCGSICGEGSSYGVLSGAPFRGPVC